jgi:hypothetical protein
MFKFTYRSLTAILSQSKKVSYLELVLILYSKKYNNYIDNNGIQRDMYWQRYVSVLSDIAVIFLSSMVVLIPNGNFWVVPLLHSVSHMSVCFTDPQCTGHWFVTSGVWHFPPLAIVSIDRGAIDPLLPIAALQGRHETKISLNMPAMNLNFFKDILTE